MTKRIGMSIIVGIVMVLATVGVVLAADNAGVGQKASETTAASTETKRETVFMDLAWGDPVETLGEDGVFITKADGGVEIYEKKNEATSLGSIPIKRIYYTFSDNQLRAILVYLSESAFNDIKRVLVAKYGEPTSDDKILESKTIWLKGDLYIQLKKDILTDEVEFGLTTVSYLKAYDARLKKQAQEDANAW